MSGLCPTPPERMVDRHGRPYFLWDNDLTLDQFVEQLRTGNDVVRAYLIAKLMRQAKPDDVFTFVGLSEIADLWTRIEPRLGRTRAMWTWLLGEWGVIEPGSGRAQRAPDPGWSSGSPRTGTARRTRTSARRVGLIAEAVRAPAGSTCVGHGAKAKILTLAA